MSTVNNGNVDLVTKAFVSCGGSATIPFLVGATGLTDRQVRHVVSHLMNLGQVQINPDGPARGYGLLVYQYLCDDTEPEFSFEELQTFWPAHGPIPSIKTVNARHIL